jgi:hypothetical protein
MWRCLKKWQNVPNIFYGQETEIIGPKQYSAYFVNNVQYADKDILKSAQNWESFDVHLFEFNHI